MGRGWHVIARFILRARIPILIFVILATAFMWMNRTTERLHDYNKLVPASDPDLVDFKAFCEEFGEDGTTLVIAFDGEIFSRKFFNTIVDLSDTLKSVDGVVNVLSMTNLSYLVANQDSQRFEMTRIAEGKIGTDEEMREKEKLLRSLPFYRGLLFDTEYKSTLIAVAIDQDKLNTPEKSRIVGEILERTEALSSKIGVTPHFSGLPYIRYFIHNFIAVEMEKFLIIAIAVMALFLLITFRSFYGVIFPLLIVGIVIVWSLGFMGLMGYKITMVTAILPSIIAVIGVPNSIYLLTKYHFEFRRTRNKIKSLILVIQKIGIVSIMTNATTAVGFVVLVSTKINMLQEFGLVAGVSVLIAFLVSLVLIPIFFSFLPDPNTKQTKHIERKMLRRSITFLDVMVTKHRPIIYVLSGALLAVSVVGMLQLIPRSKMVDDFPQDQKIISDLVFLEDHYKGVMPFEIVVNTHKKRGIVNYNTLRDLEEFQGRMAGFPEISRSLSVLDLVKFARQSLLSGVENEYQLPSREEYQILQLYTKNSGVNDLISSVSIFDSTYSKARIKANIKDIGSILLEEVIDSLDKDLVEIFVRDKPSGSLNADETYRLFGSEDFKVRYKGKEYKNREVFTTDTTTTYEVLSGGGKIDYSDRIMITGTTKLFVKSNHYLIRNLIQSLILAFIVIAVLMGVLFGSFKMVVIALLPNLIPLAVTAGIMGFAGVPLKPSTVLIFSVAFGIAVDDTIHYLARYRLARKNGDSVQEAVTNSFKDTGVSMIYTSIILFFGFVIFVFSSYGGTVALGQLTSLTLLIALFTNLLLLPSLLITFNKDDAQLPEGYINYDEEQEEVEAIREFIGDDEEE